NLTRLRRIVTAASNMRDMVDGLLELSRTAQTDLRRVPVDLARIAREVARECEAGSDRPVEFVAPVALPTTGDPTLLRVALQNLLGNAWKFSRHTEAPRVELGLDRTGDGQPVYFIRDNGAGFDPEAAGKLFGVFQRLHAQQDYPGTGVGLASVQRIVRKHGGEIWATGSPGAGATFSFTLGDEASERQFSSSPARTTSRHCASSGCRSGD